MKSVRPINHWEYRASTGRSLDALQAGKSPASAPTVVASATAPMMSSGLSAGMIRMEDRPVPAADGAPLAVGVEDLLVNA